MSYISSYAFSNGSSRSAGVTSWHNRNGAVVPMNNDYSALQIQMTPIAPNLTGSDVQTNMALINTQMSDFSAFKANSNVANGYVKLNSQGKIDESLISISNGMTCKGSFQASLNVAPTLSPVQGWYYIAQDSGTFNNINFTAGDWAIFTNGRWQKIEGSNVEYSSDITHQGYSNQTLTTVKQVIDDMDQKLSSLNALSLNSAMQNLAIFSASDLNNSTKTQRYASTYTPLVNGSNFVNSYYCQQGSICNLIVNFSIVFGNAWSAMPTNDYLMLQNDNKTLPMPNLTLGDMFFGYSFMAMNPETGMIQTPMKVKITPQGIYFRPVFMPDYIKGSDMINQDNGMIYGTINVSYCV